LALLVLPPLALLAPRQLRFQFLVGELLHRRLLARLVEQGVQVRLGEIEDALADAHDDLLPLARRSLIARPISRCASGPTQRNATPMPSGCRLCRTTWPPASPTY